MTFAEVMWMKMSFLVCSFICYLPNLNPVCACMLVGCGPDTLVTCQYLDMGIQIELYNLRIRFFSDIMYLYNIRVFNYFLC